MPYAEYRIIFDRRGKLQTALASVSQIRPGHKIEQELEQHLKWFPFYVHDALKACRRGDSFQVQSMLEEMRKLIFFAAATHHGEQIYGSKRAYQYLSQVQRQILEGSYHQPDENMVAHLAQLYLESMIALQSNYRIEDKVVSFQFIFVMVKDY